MTLYRILIEKNDSLFNKFEYSWIEAQNIESAKKKIKKLLSLKKRYGFSKKFFMIEKPAIKKITIVLEC